MDELATMRIFAKVAETCNFSEVARRVDMSVSSVSRQVNRLEETLGVRLLNRNTRQLSLTEVGQQYYAQVRAILESIDNANRMAASYQDSIKGVLKVHARTSAGTDFIAPALPAFLAQYPELSVDITLTDERADLVADGIDIAIWLGTLEDSNMVAKRLSPSRRVVCASPAYFRKHGRPGRPQDLLAHNCLVYKKPHYLDGWNFYKNGERTTVAVSGNLTTSSSGVLMSCAKSGLGLVLLQEWMVRIARKEGLLETVLTDYEIHPTESDTALYAIYPHRNKLSPKVRAFLDFLAPLFAEYDVDAAGAGERPPTAAALAAPAAALSAAP